MRNVREPRPGLSFRQRGTERLVNKNRHAPADYSRGAFLGAFEAAVLWHKSTGCSAHSRESRLDVHRLLRLSKIVLRFALYRTLESTTVRLCVAC